MREGNRGKGMRAGGGWGGRVREWRGGKQGLRRREEGEGDESEGCVAGGEQAG
jgi:hypothetical protein